MSRKTSKSKKVSMTFTLVPEAVGIVRQFENKSEFIQQCIATTMTLAAFQKEIEAGTMTKEQAYTQLITPFLQVREN